MLILDTDHLTEIDCGLARSQPHAARLQAIFRQIRCTRIDKLLVRLTGRKSWQRQPHVGEVFPRGGGQRVGARLVQRLESSGEEFATTIVSAEEQLRGWLVEISRSQDPFCEVGAYQRLQERLRFFAGWKVLFWTPEAAEIFVRLRRDGVRIGTMDLKIACIALLRNATVLTRNLKDFQQVPRLRADDWL